MTIDTKILENNIKLFKTNKKSFKKINSELYNTIYQCLGLFAILETRLKILYDYKSTNSKVDNNFTYYNMFILINDIFINIYKLNSFIIDNSNYTKFESSLL